MFVLGRLYTLRKCLVLLLSVVVFGFIHIRAVPGNSRSGSVPLIQKSRPNPKLPCQSTACLIAAVDKVIIVFCRDVSVHGNLQLARD